MILVAMTGRKNKLPKSAKMERWKDGKIEKIERQKDVDRAR